MADRVSIMAAGGAIVRTGTPREVWDYRTEFVRARFLYGQHRLAAAWAGMVCTTGFVFSGKLRGTCVVLLIPFRRWAVMRSPGWPECRHGHDRDNSVGCCQPRGGHSLRAGDEAFGVAGAPRVREYEVGGELRLAVGRQALGCVFGTRGGAESSSRWY